MEDVMAMHRFGQANPNRLRSNELCYWEGAQVPVVQLFGRSAGSHVLCINENLVANLECGLLGTIGINMLSHLFSCSFEAFKALLVYLS